MSTIANAVVSKLASWNRNAEHAIARLIIEGKYSQIKTYTNIYGEQMTQATYIENGKVVDGLGCIPRERAVEMYKQYKQTGKIRMAW